MRHTNSTPAASAFVTPERSTTISFWVAMDVAVFHACSNSRTDMPLKSPRTTNRNIAALSCWYRSIGVYQVRSPCAGQIGKYFHAPLHGPPGSWNLGFAFGDLLTSDTIRRPRDGVQPLHCDFAATANTQTVLVMVDPCQRVGYLPHQNGPLLAIVDLAVGADCRYAAVTDQFGIEFATLPFQNSPGSLV